MTDPAAFAITKVRKLIEQQDKDCARKVWEHMGKDSRRDLLMFFHMQELLQGFPFDELTKHHQQQIEAGLFLMVSMWADLGESVRALHGK